MDIIKNQILRLIVSQGLFYFRSTQLIFFLIPLIVAAVGMLMLTGGVLESFGLLVPLIEMIPNDIYYSEIFDQIEIEGGVVKLFFFISFIIYLIEIILSKFLRKKIEINDNVTLKHYFAFYTFGMISLNITIFSFAEIQGSIWEAIIVMIVVYIALLFLLVYGYFITGLTRGFAVIVQQGIVAEKSKK